MRIKYIKLFNQSAIALSCWIGLGLGVAKQSVQVAVSTNFLGTMHVIKKDFEQQTHCRVNLVAASTTVLFMQIQQGAKFDLFFSADKLHAKLLVDQHLALAKTRKTYAMGQLAFWAPGEKLTNPVEYLQKNIYQRWVLANPKLAPYGLAARQVLKKIDLFGQNKKQLISANNISQAFLYVQQRAVDGGFVALSQLIEYFPKEKVKLDDIWIIPQSYYHPLRQQVVMLKQGGDNYCAQDFVQFIDNSSVRELIRKHGYNI